MTLQTLDQCLATLGGHDTVVRRQTSAFESVAGGASNVVVMGNGHLGQIVRSGAQRAGVQVIAIADNNESLWGSSVDGVPVMPPAEAVSRYNASAFFVVAIYNGSSGRTQLKSLGCSRVVPYLLFYWQFSRYLPEELRLDLPDRILAQLHDIRRGYSSLCDDRSRAEFAAQILWRCSLDFTTLPPASTSSDMYFDPDVVRLMTDEVLVDCGAFDGDSIRMFLAKTQGAFHHIYAVEPDPANRLVLETYLSELQADGRKNVSILPYCITDRSGVLSFEASGTAGSRIAQTADATKVEARRLDDVFQQTEVTFIKMDIEGAEPAGLRGAAETILRTRPMLAICAYHQCDHLWTLPVLIKATLPDYRVYLRRYAEECWETVYYAIPPERAIGA